jgi:hypothetical protein
LISTIRPIRDNQAGPEPDIDPNRSVDRRDCLLADRLESTLSKVIGEHRKAASTISLAMAFSVMAAFYSLSVESAILDCSAIHFWTRLSGDGICRKSARLAPWPVGVRPIA